MRPLSIAAVVLVGVVAPGLRPTPARAQAATVSAEAPWPRIHVSTLDNGMDVVVVPAAASPVATAVVVFKGGSATQEAEMEEGLPHVLEHMLFRSFGGRSGRSFGSFAGEIDAGYNGTTGQEAVTYYLILPSERVEEGIDLLAELVTSPRFLEEDMETEREVVKGELERNVSDPDFLLDVIVDQTLYGPNYRQRNPIGYMPAISLSRVGVLNDYYGRHYTPDRAALVVTGDVDAEAVVARARDKLGDWDPGDEEPVALPGTAILERDTVLVVEAQTSDVSIMVRWEGPSSSSDRQAALAAELFSVMVNQPGSGTQQRLVEAGPFVSLSIGYSRDTRGGPMTLLGRTTPDKLLEASRALRQEVDILSRPWSLSDAEFQGAVLRSRVGEAILAESPQTMAHDLARRWARGEEMTSVQEVEGVTLDHVRDMVGRYFAGRPRVCGFLVPNDYQLNRAGQLIAAAQLWSGS